MTASFRATATTARFLALFPPRSASLSPQRRDRCLTTQFPIFLLGVAQDALPCGIE